MGDGEEYHARKGKDVHEIKLPELDKMDPDGMKWLMEEWVEQNPLMAAMIESLPKVVEDAKPRLAVDLLSKKEKPKLLIKRNHRHNKGKRL